MSSLSLLPTDAGIVIVNNNNTTIGVRMAGTASFGRRRLPTDPIGVTNVTFYGVIAGSEIRVFVGTTEVAGIESCSDDHVLSWSVYATGNPNNNVRILIMSEIYSIIELYLTSSVGSQSIPIQQEVDPWFSNPA